MERENPTKIEMARRAAGLSRAELSARSGVPLRTLENWEWRRTKPRDVYQLLKVSRTLGCSLEELLDLDDE